MIPVLDWRKFDVDPDGFACDLGQACRGPGFFLLTGHGVPQQLSQDVFDQAKRFFDLPEADKAPLSILTNSHKPWMAALGTESLDDTSDQVDRKQAFNIGLDLSPGDPRVMAAEPFRGVKYGLTCRDSRHDVGYYDAVWALGVALHRAFARDMGLPEHFFAPHFDAPMATLRLLSYPPATGAGGEIGAGGTYRLWVDHLADDGWRGGVAGATPWRRLDDVPHVDGAYVVNIGDCLMRWSNDTYVSTPHRVLPPKRARQSWRFSSIPIQMRSSRRFREPGRRFTGNHRGRLSAPAAGRDIHKRQNLSPRGGDFFIGCWWFFGAGDEIRTHDPYLGKVMLYP